eukprot:scpid30991/ scgid8184/ Mucosa-associated lymphoid tissue lymphoma translocation protein 1; MALT lymphoma-associated translocation; Paracaspase
MPGQAVRREKGQPLRTLASHKFSEVSAYLNVAGRWRKIIDVMPVGAYSVIEVETFAMAVRKPGGGGPGAELLVDMTIRAFTVEQLASYCRTLRYEEPLLTLLPKEPVSISKQPEDVVCSAGADVQLRVEAVGLPFPQYHWYRSMGPDNNLPIRDAHDSVLRFPRVTARDRGIYCVLVSNDVCPVFSRWCKLEVMESTLPRNIPDPPAPEIFRITRQPDPLLIHHEGDAVRITCHAVGAGPLNYEWHISNSETPSRKIAAGAHTALSIRDAKVEDTGFYRCRVTQCDRPDHEPLLSASCNLKVSRRAQPEAPKVQGKVALVIGNQHYYGRMRPLYQPESDAAELASLLTSIDKDFRVISLINLTAHEMRAAVSYFVSLLSQGIYAVFYFAGHGFQYNNESYLLPVDIGVEDGPDQCIRAEDILFQMQEAGAMFSFLILDTCRTEQSSLVHMVQSNPPAEHSKKGDYIVAHPCIPSQPAFERQSEENGIYMSHLKQYLGLNRRVEDVLMEVANSIANAYPSSVQRPEYSSSTTKVINLHDEIEPGSGEELRQYAELQRRWKLGHGAPASEEIYRAHGLCATLSFYAEFSNVLLLCIQTAIEEKETIRHLSITVDLSNVEDELCIEDLTPVKHGVAEPHTQVTNLKLRDHVSAPYCYRISAIQKLREQLGIIVKIRYECNRELHQETVSREFHAPLVASLNQSPPPPSS